MTDEAQVSDGQSSPRSGVSEGFTDYLKPDRKDKEIVPLLGRNKIMNHGFVL